MFAEIECVEMAYVSNNEGCRSAKPSCSSLYVSRMAACKSVRAIPMNPCDVMMIKNNTRGSKVNMRAGTPISQTRESDHTPAKAKTLASTGAIRSHSHDQEPIKYAIKATNSPVVNSNKLFVYSFLTDV